MLTPEQLDKIEKAAEVEIYYPAPHETRYAVVKYVFRKGQPLKVGRYYIYGEELKTGKPLISWYWMDSCNFNVVEDNFSTEEEATQRMKELKEKLR
jgi:hypothetical protein